MCSAKAELKASKNLKKIKENLPKCKRTQQILEDAVKEISSLVGKMKGYLETCDIVGLEAFKANILRPKDIFDKYHSGPKLTHEEISAKQKVK